MLGPEQVNLGIRALPQTFTSLPSLQISNDVYRGLSLSTSQIVAGVIALEHVDYTFVQTQAESL